MDESARGLQRNAPSSHARQGIWLCAGVLAVLWLAPADLQGQHGGQLAGGRTGTSAESAPPLPADAFVQAAADNRTQFPPAQSRANTAVPAQASDPSRRGLAGSNLASSLQMMLLVTVLSLAPSILIMTTCFIRFVVVLGLLKQAMGTQQLPPNQVMVSLCLFLTYLVMSPVWERAYHEGIQPYTQAASEQERPSLELTLERTLRPIRTFMIDQIEATGNSSAVHMFLEFRRPAEGTTAARTYVPPQTYDEVPLSVLMPAFMLSELKTAFVIGFQIYLPFLVIDMVVSSVLISMGMLMLPPMLISLPFKLLLFVMIDGWHLTVEMLLKTVVVGGG